jgi:hypothetical protein
MTRCGYRRQRINFADNRSISNVFSIKLVIYNAPRNLSRINRRVNTSHRVESALLNPSRSTTTAKVRSPCVPVAQWLLTVAVSTSSSRSTASRFSSVLRTPGVRKPVQVNVVHSVSRQTDPLLPVPMSSKNADTPYDPRDPVTRFSILFFILSDQRDARCENQSIPLITGPHRRELHTSACDGVQTTAVLGRM